MEEEYVEQDSSMSELNRNDGSDGEPKDSDMGGGWMEDGFEDDEGGNFRGNRTRGNFRNRGRGPPPGWMNGPPPMRFRGRGYGPSGPPMRGRGGFFRGRGGPRGFGPNNGPNFDNNWGPMGPPPPGMMGGPPPFGPPPGMMGPGGPMGPPPNMMGQPPPFGGPPGMPPPNMPAPELWVETKSEDGKSYYYHARTRETTWTRPQDTPTCKVITQAEMEAMVHAGQMPGMGGPQMPMNGPMGGGGMPGPMGMMPNGMMPGMMPPGVAPSGGPPPQAGVPPFMTQPPPWAKDGNKEKQADELSPSQSDNDDIPLGDSQPSNNMFTDNMMPFPGGPGGVPGGGAGVGPGPVPGPGFPPGGPAGAGFPPGSGPPGSGFPPGNGPPGTGFPPGNGPPGSGFPPGGVPPGTGFPPGNGPPGAGFPPVSGPPGTGFPPGNGPPGAGFPPGNGPPGAGFPPGGGPPGAGPGQGAWGGWGGGWPPPLVGQPPPALAAANVPPAGAASGLPAPTPAPASLMAGAATPSAGAGGVTSVDATPEQPQTQPATKEETTIPPELAAAAAEWTSHRAPDGRAYYYHAGRGESVWEKPKPMKELEELQAKIAIEKGEKPEKKKLDHIDIDESKIEVIDVEAHAEAQAAAEAERRAAAERQKELEREKQEKERLEKERLEKERLEKEKADKEKAKQDKSRPISSTPISGTPWCVVWTGDGRVFFYNPTAHSSVWERPAQLLGRADVDKAVSQPPAALLELQKKEAANNPTAKSSNGELKRAADTSSDDSDAEPVKKAKPDESVKKTSSSVIDVGKEAAIEAEVRAARERAVVPLDQRVKSFRQMLVEKEVSAFSTWEKELHKIVFDCRYLLLTSKERKQVFDKYVRERAEEERKEKKNRLQQKKNLFRTLMEEAKIHSKSSFSDFSSKHGRDERFKGIDKQRDRELYFNEYLAEVRKKEKEEKEKKRDQAKNEFITLLKEKAVDRHARWLDVKKKLESDPRYKAVESSTAREDYFRDYCKMVKEERKKEKDSKDKERDRSSKKDKKDKDRDKEKEKDRDKDKEEKKSKKKEKGEEPKPEETAEMEQDAVEAGSDEEAAVKEKEARAQASIKEREKEVQRALATSLRDRDKEREFHKRDEAVQHFNALLADLVRNADLSWHDAKKQLKKDHRYKLAELLTKDDKERLFIQHTGTLASKRRDKLRALLEELGVTHTAHWRDVRVILKDDQRMPVYTSTEKLEREFRDYQRDRQSAAKTALRQLLLETRSISHKSLSQVKENQQAMQAIHDSLKHDARYLALEHIADERQQMITQYLEELEKKGPPPPPTASEPSRRAK